jgi:energy-converting hydrogenase B subunit D
MNFITTDYWIMVLLFILVVTALSMYFIKNLLHAVIVYGAYGLTMAIIWLLMNAPDLAITEAAAGICTTVLMIMVVYRTSRREEEK